MANIEPLFSLNSLVVGEHNYPHNAKIWRRGPSTSCRSVSYLCFIPMPLQSHVLFILVRNLRPRMRRRRSLNPSSQDRVGESNPYRNRKLWLTRNILSLPDSEWYTALTRHTSKHGDTSATYWRLYMSEAKINDEKLIESLRGDTNSMVFLVRDNLYRWFRGSLTGYLTEHFVLIHRRIICHRNIQKALPQILLSESAYWSSLRCTCSDQHRVVS